ncbi:hypothetical protein, partial [Escherichia fergusonii]|uniref:hypothetical protein n=1 Tax=Escherichia fergusonii TaxID=564 RepID=UPI001E4051D1
VTLKMPAFEWVHVQLHQQKGMISLSPPTICNSAPMKLYSPFFHNYIQTARKAVTGDLICNLLVKLMYQKRWFL